MNTRDESAENKLYLQRSFEIAIRLALVALIIVSCFRIFSPFLTTVVWGVVIAVALFPIFDKVRQGLGGRSRLAGSLFIALGLLGLLIPTYMMSQSAIDEADTLMTGLEAGTLNFPPPSEKVQTWPLIGEELYHIWQDAAVNLSAVVQKYSPQLKVLGSKLGSLMATVGAAVLQSLFAIIIAGILMMNSQVGSKKAQNIGYRLAGEEGVALMNLSAATIRSVFRGVLLVAIIQGLLAAIGLWVAEVPAAGLWALLVTIVAVIQLPPILILGPIILYVFSVNDNTTVAVIFMIWSLIVSVADGFLKPLFLGRGIDVPMLVILIGAIGGMLQHGVLGLFIGPVILAVGYQLFASWMGLPVDEKNNPTAPETASD